MIKLRQIRKRDELPALFDEFGYKVGVEVGTKEGYFAEHILKNSNIELLYCVDVWTDEDDYRKALSRLLPPRVLMTKEKSVNAAKHFADGSLDFVYIDADHSYQAVKTDYEVWLPKIRIGGMICGHDYGINGDCEGVKKFIDELGVEQFMFTTDDFFEGRPYQTWYKLV